MTAQTTTLRRCRDFLSNEIVPAPLIINREEFLVLVGTLLSAKDAPCAVINGQKGTYESIYGYQIVNLILESKPEELYSRLWTKAWRAAEISPPSPLPTIQLDDKCTKALGLMAANRFGNLLFLDRGKPAGLLSIHDIVRFLAGKTKSIRITLKEVSSQLNLVDRGESLGDVFRFMMRNRVRRVVIKRRGGGGFGGFYCCTEREIIKALFSLNGLQSLRDNPRSLLGMPIEHLVSPYLSLAPSLHGSLDVAEGWIHAARSTNCTVIIDDEWIASPWDLVVKPFLAGKLPF